MKKYKELLKNILLFAISSFIPKTINFFLIPLYTAYLTTSEYGVSDLINTTVSLFIPVFTLNIKDSVLRFSLDKKCDKKDTFNIAIRIVFLDFLILFVFSFLQLSFHFINIEPLYLFFFSIMLISNSIYEIFNSFCKGIDKVNTIVAASIVSSISTLLLNILLISVFKMGLLGFLIANSFGTILSDIIYLIFAKLYKFFSFNYSKKLMKEMIKYSFPMIFSALAWWVNTSSDRYIITFLSGLSISGIYAVASKIPSILTTFQSVFMQAWSISAIKEFDKNDSDGFIGNIYSLLSCFLCIICSLLIIFNICISKIMFSKDFFMAWKFVPPLMLSVTIDGLSLFIGHLFYAVKDTKSRALATIIGALVNTVFNFILIYIFSAYGASIATLLGYFSGFVISRILIKKYIIINTNMRRNDLSLVLLLFQVLLSFFANKYFYLQVCLFLFLIYIYLNELKKITRKIKDKLFNILF